MQDYSLGKNRNRNISKAGKKTFFLAKLCLRVWDSLLLCTLVNRKETHQGRLPICLILFYLQIILLPGDRTFSSFSWVHWAICSLKFCPTELSRSYRWDAACVAGFFMLSINTNMSLWFGWLSFATQSKLGTKWLWETKGCARIIVFFWRGRGGQILSDLITCLAIRAEAIPTLAVVNKNDLVSNHSW